MYNILDAIWKIKQRIMIFGNNSTVDYSFRPFKEVILLFGGLQPNFLFLSELC